MEMLLVALSLFVSHVFYPAKDMREYVNKHQHYAFWATPLDQQRIELRWAINRSIEIGARTHEHNSVVVIQWYDNRIKDEAIADLRKEGYTVDEVKTTKVNEYGTELRVLRIQW